MRTIRGLAILLAGTSLLAGCKRDEGRAVSVVGSTSIQPFAELLAQAYGKKGPAHQVEVQGGGSTAGLQAVTNGLAQIGMCSRALKEDESKQFTPVVIARDGLAVVVNRENPVAGLTVEQIRNVFSGKITNWKDIGGRDGVIRVVTREEGSGTRESFVHLVMEKEAITKQALNQESNGAVKEIVKGDPAAIGFMSLGLVGKELKALTVDGAEPTHQAVLDGKYKLARPFLFVTKGAPDAVSQAFIDFVLSAEGQKMLEEEGLVRAK